MRSFLASGAIFAALVAIMVPDASFAASSRYGDQAHRSAYSYRHGGHHTVYRGARYAPHARSHHRHRGVSYRHAYRAATPLVLTKRYRRGRVVYTRSYGTPAYALYAYQRRIYPQPYYQPYYQPSAAIYTPYRHGYGCGC